MGAAHSSTATLTHGAVGRMSRMATLESGSQHCAVAGAGDCNRAEEVLEEESLDVVFF